MSDVNILKSHIYRGYFGIFNIWCLKSYHIPLIDIRNIEPMEWPLPPWEAHSEIERTCGGIKAQNVNFVKGGVEHKMSPVMCVVQE